MIWLRRMKASVLRERALQLADLESHRAFPDFKRSLGRHLEVLQAIAVITTLKSILTTAIAALLRLDLIRVLPLIRARIRARQSILDPSFDPVAVREALFEAVDAPARIALGRFDSPAARTILQRISPDTMLADDLACFLRQGSSKVDRGRIHTFVWHQVRLITVLWAIGMAWMTAIAYVIPSIWGSQRELLLYLFMSALLLTYLLWPLMKQLRREIKVRDSVNALPFLRQVK